MASKHSLKLSSKEAPKLTRPVKVVLAHPIQVQEYPDLYNSSHHSITELPYEQQAREESPIDKAAHFGNWSRTIAVSARHTHHDIHVLTVPNDVAQDLIDISSIASLCDKLRKEHLHETIHDFLFSQLSDISPPTPGWFLRLDALAPRDAEGRISPVRTCKDIMHRLSTCRRTTLALTTLLILEQPIFMYLLPYNPSMDPARQFRVFCPPGGHISAVSQYHWCKPLKWWPYKGELEAITAYIQSLHRDILDGEHDLTPELVEKGFAFDVLYDPHCRDNPVQLIKLKAFGALSDTGGCLFHWILDQYILYAKEEEEPIVFAISREEDRPRLPKESLKENIKPGSTSQTQVPTDGRCAPGKANDRTLMGFMEGKVRVQTPR